MILLFDMSMKPPFFISTNNFFISTARGSSICKSLLAISLSVPFVTFRAVMPDFIVPSILSLFLLPSMSRDSFFIDTSRLAVSAI